MPPGREHVERRAAQAGFATGTVEKVVRLGERAADIVRHPLLGPRLVLKGGTAFNLCSGSPARPALLFPDDPALASPIAMHPAIQWKLVDVRGYLSRNKKPRTAPARPDGKSEA